MNPINNQNKNHPSDSCTFSSCTNGTTENTGGLENRTFSNRETSEKWPNTSSILFVLDSDKPDEIRGTWDGMTEESGGGGETSAVTKEFPADCVI